MEQNIRDSNKIPLVKVHPRSLRANTLRIGRGFSYGELRQAGLSVDEAKVAGLPIDRLRRSAHEENVKALGEFGGKRGKEGARKSRSSEKGKALTPKKRGAAKKAPVGMAAAQEKGGK